MDEPTCNFVPFLIYVIGMTVLSLHFFAKANDKMSVGDFLFMILFSWAFVPFFIMFKCLGTTIWKKKEEEKPWK